MSKIIFGDIQNKKELEGIRMIDMHNHSNYSDGDNIKDIISKAKKFNMGVCLTDHDEIKGSLIACKEILSIPSTELTSSEGYDLLAYFNSEKDTKEFFEKRIYGNRLPKRLFSTWKLKIPMGNLVDYLKEYNTLISLPHPFTIKPKDSHTYFEKKENFKTLKKIDAIEGVNAMMSPSRNKRAIEMADSLGKPITGGSDAHAFKYIGSVFTGCFAETRTEFIEEIRKGKNWVIVKKELSFFPRSFAGLDILRRNVSLFEK